MISKANLINSYMIINIYNIHIIIKISVNINVYLYKCNYYFFLYKRVIEYWSLDSDYCNTILKNNIKLHIIELSILFAR